MGRLLLGLLGVALTLSGCALREAGLSSVSEQAERLAEERGRLIELTNPLERIRSYVTVSGILAGFAASLAYDGNTDDMNALLTQFDRAIQDATALLSRIERNSETEVLSLSDIGSVLAGQIRTLRRLNERLNPEDRPPAATALANAVAARDQILKLVRNSTGHPAK